MVSRLEFSFSFSRSIYQQLSRRGRHGRQAGGQAGGKVGRWEDGQMARQAGRRAGGQIRRRVGPCQAYSSAHASSPSSSPLEMAFTLQCFFARMQTFNVFARPLPEESATIRLPLSLFSLKNLDKDDQNATQPECMSLEAVFVSARVSQEKLLQCSVKYPAKREEAAHMNNSDERGMCVCVCVREGEAGRRRKQPS